MHKDPSALEAVFFDLDGTLVDSVGDLTAALVDFLRPYELPSFSEEAVKRWMGTDADDIIAGLFSDFSVDPGQGFDLAASARQFLDFYDSYPHNRSVAFDGASDLLHVLQSKGIKIGICTNKRSALSREILQDLGLMTWIDIVVGSDTTDHKKPHPAPLLYGLAQIRVAPANAIMVGDSISDVRVGQAANVAMVVGADYGYPRKPEDLDGADRRIGKLADMRELVAEFSVSL